METDTYEPQRGLTFDDVWAALMETRKHQEENAREMKENAEANARQMKENAEANAREMKEYVRKMEESARRLDKVMGDLGNRFGELAEHLVAPNILEKFNALGYHFNDVSRDREIVGPDRTVAEIDLFMANGEFAIAIEVKTKARNEHIDDHVRRMEILRQSMDNQHDARKLRGAIASPIMSEAVRNYTLKAGFYVIEQAGDTVKITIPPGFTPREW
jgi:hypothetical protein